MLSPWVRDAVADAFLNRAELANTRTEALELYQEVLEICKDAKDYAASSHIHSAYKGITKFARGGEEKSRLYNEGIARLRELNNLQLVAYLTMDKAEATADRTEKAAIYDDVVKEFDCHEKESLADVANRALFNKSSLVENADEKVAILDLLIERYEKSSNPWRMSFPSLSDLVAAKAMTLADKTIVLDYTFKVLEWKSSPSDEIRFATLLARKLGDRNTAQRILDAVIIQYEGSDDRIIADEVVRAKAARSLLDGYPEAYAKLLDRNFRKRQLLFSADLEAPETPYRKAMNAFSNTSDDEEKLRIMDEFLNSRDENITALERGRAWILKAEQLSDQGERRQAAEQAITFIDEAVHDFSPWHYRRRAYEIIAQSAESDDQKKDLLKEITEKYSDIDDTVGMNFLLYFRIMLTDDPGDKMRLLVEASDDGGELSFANKGEIDRIYRKLIEKSEDREEKKRLYDLRIKNLLPAGLRPFFSSVLVERAELEEDEAARDALLEQIPSIAGLDPGFGRSIRDFFSKWIDASDDAEERARRRAKQDAYFRRHGLCKELIASRRAGHQLWDVSADDLDALLAEFSTHPNPDIQWEVVLVRMDRILMLLPAAEKGSAFDELLSEFQLSDVRRLPYW